ncbi:MAG: hypothetical protein OEV80_10125, partial [candidate division Zixibacteria bacterium]|nr:hypothetical protein [candidate division Zixibacteria bacterium]
LSLNLSVSGNRLRVEVVRCQAITPDGGVIEINEATREQVRAESDVGSNEVPVYIGIDTSVRQPVGEPDPQDDLPRLPYLAGNYKLALGSPPDLPTGQYFQIASLTVGSSDVAPAEYYYPPCISLYADEQLTAKALDYRNRLENLLSLSSRAYMAVCSGGALSGEKTDLQQAFKDTIYQFAYHLSSTLDDYIVGKNAGHPIQLVMFFKKLFRSFTTLLNLQPGLKDLLNERFFVKEMNSDVGRFMSHVDAFLLADYNHNDLGGHIRAIDDILTQVRGVFGYLAQVKKEQLGEQAVATDTLTYHGQTYRVVDYGSCHTEQVGELTYLTIDIANPAAVTDTVVLLNKDLVDTARWTSMQVRLGLNEARGLGETDPVEIDVVTYGNKVALHPQDMLRSPSVSQITLVFRGAGDVDRFAALGKMDLIVYAI